VARRAVEDENARWKPAWRPRPSWFVRAGGPVKAPITVEADALMRLGAHRSEVALRARQVPGQALDTFMTESIHRGGQYGISVL